MDTLGDPPDVPRGTYMAAFWSVGHVLFYIRLTLYTVLVGTKKDLEDKRQVNYHDAEALAESWGVPYVEASSKTGDNVPEVFQTLLVRNIQCILLGHIVLSLSFVFLQKEVEKDDGLLAESGLDGECLIL